MFGQFFGFGGRIGRGTWWMAWLLCIILVCFSFGLLMMQAKVKDQLFAVIFLSLLSLASSLSSIVVMICATVKRYHDRNKSGWWWWIGFVPILGFWQLIECGFCSGDDDENEYGPPPGSISRSSSLNLEVGALASSGRLAKIDDNFFANYARETALRQAQQQMATAGNSVPAGSTRPTFGKR